jgi:hypothetical protein
MPLMDNTNSAIKVTPSLEQEIAGASSNSEIQAILHRAAIDQKIVEPDPFDPRGENWFTMRPVAPGSVSAAKGFAKVVRLNGEVHSLIGTDEADLTRQETELYRAVLASPAATTQEESQPRNERGQFITHDPSAVALAPSVTAALESMGVDVNALREYTATKQVEAFDNAWRESTETFRNSQAGASWPGGIANRQKLGECLLELGLADNPSAENLSKAYEYMKKNDLLVENEAIALVNKVNAATSYNDLKQQIGYRGYDHSDSSVWGR